MYHNQQSFFFERYNTLDIKEGKRLLKEELDQRIGTTINGLVKETLSLTNRSIVNENFRTNY